MPTVHVDLLDTKVTLKQKLQLAESLTKVASETLGESEESITIIFKSTSARDIARGGKPGR